MSKDVNQIKSPCIKICSLNDDNVCIGCYRNLDEIYKWARADSEMREAILNNTKMRILEYSSDS